MDEVEAARCYDMHVLRLHGPSAPLNFDPSDYEVRNAILTQFSCNSCTQEPDDVSV